MAPPTSSCPHVPPPPLGATRCHHGPPATPGLLLLLLGLAAAERECSPCLLGPGPIAALVVADIIMTLLIAGGAYCLARRSQRAAAKPRPPEMESTYQELQGTRRDIYSELKR
ncbi:TYRO protein tyrosine kinase-binding protein [Ciconia boyciana]|uniref:TYRO protein tyrosine kinase-binding protein n=1 Tax=Ciconia boyciana TaxID=52775 RepID=UPI003BA00131